MSSGQSEQRQSMIDRLEDEVFDCLVVGAGINGAVSSLFLSAKGVKTALIDKGDFASSTSQESSSLAWGGIKYLEGLEFSLVWNLCRSRNELVNKFPSQVEEIRFFTALKKGFRKPRFFVFLGTLLYWVMGRFATKMPRLLSRSTIANEEPHVDISDCQGGVEYSDCYFKDTDTRFTFNLIKQAGQQNAVVANYIEAVEFQKESQGVWLVRCLDRRNERDVFVRARSIINAGGPYVDKINQSLGVKTEHRHLFSKGVHLIVPSITKSEKVLTFFAEDGRMFFVVPMGTRSCVGTTDTPVSQLPPVVEDSDRQFILSNINQSLNLKNPLTLSDIIAERCGVRPLAVEARDQASSADWLKLSRKHVVESNGVQKVISIFGGKLTDCLNVGREIVEEIARFGIHIPFPGSGFVPEVAESKDDFHHQAMLLGLNAGHAEILWRRYLQDAFSILRLYRTQPSSRRELVPGYPLTLAELDFIAKEEYICNLDDILRRRSNLAQDFDLSRPEHRSVVEAIAERVFKSDSCQFVEEYFNKLASARPKKV